jgi:23S rRNA pseudouridine1911/1915/1917 synthase
MKISELNKGIRLDIFANSQLPTLSRSSVQKLIADGSILVNGDIEKTGYKLRENDIVDINFNAEDHLVKDLIELPILYEDNDCIVIDKPAGVLTHSKGAFNNEATVASFISDKIDKSLSGNRAGIVHRLDRGTSGVIICAKNEESSKWLQKQFSTRKVKKTYVAVCQNTPEHDEAVIDMPIERNPKMPQTFRAGPNGKSAVTNYKVLKSNKSLSLIELNPLTGRTHQLRVHLKSIKCPIVGDELYGGKHAERMLLHAKKLELTLPNRDRVVFESKVPDAFEEMLK